MKVKENELRIGNLLLFKFTNREDEVLPISEIHNGFLVLGTQIAAMKYIEPIPLTEDWLLRFGFIKQINQASPYAYLWYLGQFRIWQYGESDIPEYFGITLDRQDVICNTVHSLQNLFFCLTRTELQLTPLKLK